MREENSDSGASKKIFSNQEKRSYCIAWEKSGLSKRVFSKMEGFPPSTFYSWYSLFKKQRLDAPSFSPVVVKSSPSIERQDMIQFEMHLPNQAQLFITMREHGLVSFIQELCHAVTVIR